MDTSTKSALSELDRFEAGLVRWLAVNTRSFCASRPRFQWIWRVARKAAALFDLWRAYGWPAVGRWEPYDGRLSRTVPDRAGGETPRLLTSGPRERRRASVTCLRLRAPEQLTQQAGAHHREAPWAGVSTGRAEASHDKCAAQVALVANCLLNQNAKVAKAPLPGLVSPVVEVLRKRDTCCCSCPVELAFARCARWWAVYEQ